MKHIISLVLGDPFHDGHGKSETININSNLSKSDIEKAYKAGCQKLSFDFCNTVANDYEDTLILPEYWEKLKALGYKNNKVEEEAKYYNDGEFHLWVDSFVDIYLFIIKLGNSEFEFEYLTDEQTPEIMIGGYGLFE